MQPTLAVTRTSSCFVVSCQHIRQGFAPPFALSGLNGLARHTVSDPLTINTVDDE